ncbi:hypothetical protein BDZ91DRAFT_682657, partial [Kalaharituber pfeilii]
MPGNAPAATSAAPPPQSAAQINLSVLQRYSPAITSLVTTASYAVVYVFNSTEGTWDRLGIEGSLFICGLNGSNPSLPPNEYQVIVLNRRNLDNFIVPLTSPEDIELAEKYIILR